jgi:hypothetical protein
LTAGANPDTRPDSSDAANENKRTRSFSWI